MTNNFRSPGRRRVVRFGTPLSAEDKGMIQNMLQDSGAGAAEFHGDSCTIHYPFPELSLDAIFNMLSSARHTIPKKRLSDLIAIFLENNERSHVTNSSGWKHNVEDVYIHYFNRYTMEREDIRRQTWRKYKE